MARVKKQIINGCLECSNCQNIKKVSEFNIDVKNSFGYKSQCKQCNNNSKVKKTTRRRGVIASKVITRQDKINVWNERLRDENTNRIKC